MSELRKECYKCLNNKKCYSGADYNSVYCHFNRKFNMGIDYAKTEDKQVEVIHIEKELIENRVRNLENRLLNNYYENYKEKYKIEGAIEAYRAIIGYSNLFN